MAVTMKTRAGRTLKFHVRLWEPGKEKLSDTSNHTCRLELRGTQLPRRVLLSTNEYNGELPAPAGTILTKLEDGHWLVVLGRTLTRSFPPKVTAEVELHNNADPEDVSSLFEAIIHVEPELVVSGA